MRWTRWADALPVPEASLAIPPLPAPEGDQPAPEALVECYGPLEIACDWGRASGRFTGQAFTVLEDGTLRCPADKLLRPQERRTEADGTVRMVYRAKQADYGSCALAPKCLGRQASGRHPRRVSAVRKRVAEPGGYRAALVQPMATRLDLTAEQTELVWQDLPGYRIRHDYVGHLRQQRVTIVELRGAEPVGVVPAAQRTWTRAEWAHRRLSWAAWLARNRCAAGPPRHAFTVFGIVPALTTYLGLSPGLAA